MKAAVGHYVAGATPVQQRQYPSQQAQDDAQLQEALEQSELEAALAASRLASHSGASPSGRPPRPAAVEHKPSDDEELKLALAMSEADAKQAEKGKGVLRQSTSERELQQALQESAQLGPAHKQQHRNPAPCSSGEGSTSSYTQQTNTEDEDLARALHESQQLAAASAASSHAASSAAPSSSLPPRQYSPRQQTPSAPQLPSAPHVQQHAISAAPQSASQQPHPQSNSSSAPTSSSPMHNQRNTQSSSSLYPQIFQPGMPITHTQPSSHHGQPRQQQAAMTNDLGPLYSGGHHGSAHLESMLSADEAFAKALQEEELAGAISERVQQAGPPPVQANSSSPQSGPRQTGTPLQNSKGPTPSRHQSPSSSKPASASMPQQQSHAQTPQPRGQQLPLRGVVLDPSLCAACGTPLKRKVPGTTQWTTVKGVNYHPECFRCTACQQPIGANAQYSTGQDGLPYHMMCHQELFDPKCAVCHDFIPAEVCSLANTVCFTLHDAQCRTAVEDRVETRKQDAHYAHYAQDHLPHENVSFSMWSHSSLKGINALCMSVCNCLQSCCNSLHSSYLCFMTHACICMWLCQASAFA